MSLNKKTALCYSSGTLFRDLAYVLVSLFFITFVQYTGNLTGEQFMTLTALLVVCRLWDAINDPLMSLIITNTRSRFGRYRPWVLAGALSNAVFLVLLFLSPGLEGWAYVAYLGVVYLLWGMTFTMNDVSYWSILPALARSKDARDKLTGWVAIFASIGQFVSGGLIPVLTTGNMVIAYRTFAVASAILFVLSQIMVFACVREPGAKQEDSVRLRQMVRIIARNKQLCVMAAIVFLFTLGSSLLNAFGANFFYFKFGYQGVYMTVFTVVYALGTLGAQLVFDKLAKRYSRARLLHVSTILLVAGYLIFFALSNLPASVLGGDWMYLAVLSVFGLLIFAGQGVFYLTMLIMLANTIEYDQWKHGARNESIIFTVRPFMVKLAGSLQQALVTAVLMATGLYAITTSVSDIEIQIGKGLMASETGATQATELLQAATGGQLLGLTVGMTLVPIVLFLAAYVLARRKYVIDETMYETMTAEIAARDAQATGKA